jgi:hypothetical protein
MTKFGDTRENKINIIPFTKSRKEIYNNKSGEIQDGEWDRAADLMSSVNKDSAEMVETYLAEVKHQGELKVWHSKPLDHGKLHTTIQ